MPHVRPETLRPETLRPEPLRPETVAPPPASTPAPIAPAASGAEPVAGGLTTEQMQTLQVARWDGRKVTRAAGVATFSGWTMVTFAAITLVTGLFSLPTLILGIGMAIGAKVELSGARGMRRLDPDASRKLGLNQLAFGALLAAYGGWGIIAAIIGPGPYDDQIAAGGQVAEMLGPVATLQMLITVSVYGGVIVGGLIATGGAALYYFTRRRHIVAYLARTPAWVVETVRAVDPAPPRRRDMIRPTRV